MNSKTKDVRQMLFNLRKKYCVDIAKRYSKNISSSSDDLSSDEDLNPSISKSSIEKVSTLTPKRESAVKDVQASLVKIPSDIEYKPNSNPSECGSVKSLESLNSVKSVLSPQRVPSERVSSISSVRTDIDEDEDSDVEEDLSEASDSSVPNVLANVHLISDDILEDADTNDSSDRSNVDYEGRSSGGRLSVVHSIKSIQLGSPIEPPDLEHMDYESDFESSDNSSEFETSPRLETAVTGDKVTRPNDYQPSLKMNEYVLNKSDSDQNSSCTKSHSESILKAELGGNISDHSDGTEDVNRDRSLEKTVSDGMISENDTEKHLSSRNTSVSNYSGSHEHHTSNDDEEYKNQYFFQSKSNSKIIIDSGNVVNQNTNTDIKIPIEYVGGKGSFYDLTPGINSGSSSNRKCTEEKIINPEDKVCKKQDTVVENNGNGIKSNVISVGVQTSQRETESVHLENKFFEKSDVQSKRRQKVFYVNTSVKSTKYRPVVEAGKFSLTNMEANGFNTYSFPDQVTEGMPVEELINEILRSQIAMTKQFMDCHHSLYVQCCQVVQSMNQEYKKNKICFINP